MDAKSFLDIVAPNKPQGNGFRLAEVTEIVTSPYPGAKVQFDGETTPALKPYPTLTTVGLEVGSRVLLVPVSTSMVIVGALGEGYVPPEPTQGLITTFYDAAYSPAASGLTITSQTTALDVPDTTVTVTTTTPNATAIVTATWDFRQSGGSQTAANCVMVGEFWVAGVVQSKQALVSALTNIRLASSVTYKIPLATAGSYTFKMTARRSSTAPSAGALTCMQQHTGWVATVYETP